jgi:co-chaperonin GroES (HSP10)
MSNGATAMKMKVTNLSGIHPVGVAVLVKPHEPEVAASVLVLPPNVKVRQSILEDRVIVIEVGPEAWSDEKEPRAAVGDKVMITAVAGRMVLGPLDDQQYRIVNDRDIMCRIEEKGDNHG